jgi:hypothetical protein
MLLPAFTSSLYATLARKEYVCGELIVCEFSSLSHICCAYIKDMGVVRGGELSLLARSFFFRGMLGNESTICKVNWLLVCYICVYSQLHIVEFRVVVLF